MVFPLPLVVEDDALDVGAALQETLFILLVHAIDLEVIFQFWDEERASLGRAYHRNREIEIECRDLLFDAARMRVMRIATGKVVGDVSRSMPSCRKVPQ